MKLLGQIDLHVSGERILRRPTVWDKILRALGSEPDLSTPDMRALLEATAVVEVSRAALRALGVTNAVSLARVERPTVTPAARRAAPTPSSPRYDPYEVYYPNPLGTVLSAMVWSSIFSMAMTPDVVVVNERGQELGSPEDVGPDLGDDTEGYDDGMGGEGWKDAGQDAGGDPGGDQSDDMGGDFGDSWGDFGGD